MQKILFFDLDGMVRVPSNKQKEFEEFGRKVKQAYEDSKQRYGAVKICRILNGNGFGCRH